MKLNSIQENGQDRPPAKATLTFMHRAENKFDNIENSMNNLSTDFKLMKKDIEHICGVMEQSNKQNKEEHDAIMSRLGRIEKFAITILAIFALVALYFLFAEAGLPTP